MRRRIRYLLPVAAVALLGLALVATAQSGDDGKRDHMKGKHPRSAAGAALKNADGRTVGQVRLFERHNGKVGVLVRARGLTPGFHGFHIHEKGVCEPTDFKSAGGHFKRGAQAHGAHAGDLPPLLVMRDGKARAAFVTDSFHVRDLLTGDGSAAMIHAAPDNLTNIPTRYKSGASTTPGPDEETLKTGDSGGRVACGVVQRKRHRR